jgi:hypothetical protein
MAQVATAWTLSKEGVLLCRWPSFFSSLLSRVLRRKNPRHVRLTNILLLYRCNGTNCRDDVDEASHGRDRGREPQTDRGRDQVIGGALCCERRHGSCLNAYLRERKGINAG